MTPLRVKQIKSKLLDLFEKHLDLSDIKPTDLQREQKVPRDASLHMLS
ncbi:hypothetical protein HFO33_33550 [Rhizobium leguminosarum]|nr:hypothetical protein [Rhizobium leguminosarum]MBY5721425.1 hypothetical protein [Rhizobium leguminosarum]